MESEAKELRHYSATQLLTAGTDLNTVAGRLGHAEGSTTLQFYANPRELHQPGERHQRRAADHRVVRPSGFTWNLAIATGTPGPDVLDIDQHGPTGNGYPAFARLERSGLVDGAAAHVRTPADGMHAYFTGSHQLRVSRPTAPGRTRSV